MATKTITTLICDECGSDEGVRSYRIAQGQRARKVDLCLGDSEFLEKHLHKRKSPARRNVVSVQEAQRRRISR